MIEKYTNTYKIIYNIIKRFGKHYRKKPLRIEVLKLIYLVDIEYYKKYGEKYSELNYIYYNYGPWDRVFHEIIEYMVEIEISEFKMQTQEGNNFYLYITTKKNPRNETKLEAEVSDILENIFFIYKYSQLTEMLKIVYNQEPMASTKKGELIDMSKLDLNARTKRELYQQKRHKYLEKVSNLENKIDEDDLDLYFEFKRLRKRANSTI